MQPSAKPSQGERRRVREYARQHGLRYADALRAIRAGAPTPVTRRYWHVPFPQPLLDEFDPGCASCDGRGVAGALYSQELNDAVLLCDQVCAACEGCGSAWCRCAPLWLDDGMDWRRDEDDDVHVEAGFAACPSCRDRGFALVRAFDPDDADADVRPLRMPCGCMSDFMVDVTDILVTDARMEK